MGKARRGAVYGLTEPPLPAKFRGSKSTSRKEIGPRTMYAVFKSGGKQFRVEPGHKVRVPLLPAQPGDTVTFDQVLLASNGSQVSVGAPLVSGATVTGQVLRHGREKKVIVFKRKRRSGWRRKRGHRQGFTEVFVNQVAL